MNEKESLSWGRTGGLQVITEERQVHIIFTGQSVIYHKRGPLDVLWMLWGGDAHICLGISGKAS